MSITIAAAAHRRTLEVALAGAFALRLSTEVPSGARWGFSQGDYPQHRTLLLGLIRVDLWWGRDVEAITVEPGRRWER